MKAAKATKAKIEQIARALLPRYGLHDVGSLIATMVKYRSRDGYASIGRRLDPHFEMPSPNWRRAYALVGQPPRGPLRQGMPWNRYEDETLLRKVRELAPYLHGSSLWKALAEVHARSALAVHVRHRALMAGLRLAET